MKKRYKKTADGDTVDKKADVPVHYMPEAWEERQRQVQESLRRVRKRGRKVKK